MTTWSVDFDVTPENRRRVESLTALSNGRFGTKGLLAAPDDIDRSTTVASGIFDGAPVPSLLRGPVWSAVDLGERRTEQATLDLRRGVLESTVRCNDAVTVRATEFVSRRRDGLHALMIDGWQPQRGGPPPLLTTTGPGERSLMVQSEVDDPHSDGESSAPANHPRTRFSVTSHRGAMTAAAAEWFDAGTTWRIAAMAAGSPGELDGLRQRCEHDLDEALAAGWAQLLEEHVDSWAERWAVAAIDLPADPDLERALRFTQYHLLSASDDSDECGIAARGLTGLAYRGHVFWDGDVFVVPALSAMAPDLARTALRYRFNRLDTARARAAEEGRRGARFPWESASSGVETTPTEARDLQGRLQPIRTGEQEEHIVADVAWALQDHLAWTGDDAFAEEVVQPVLIDTARYWDSRIDQEGEPPVGHIRQVIGPDEYHEAVDDNVFTNEMARWNLECAAELDAPSVSGEQDSWRRTAQLLVVPHRNDEGCHEQFNGFFELEPVMVDSIGTPPLPADALLGRDRIEQVQIIKQPDVLMLHHLFPDRMPPGSLDADLDCYLPRTAHGSSLSPAITGSLLARAGRLDEAVRWIEMAARFDLDDISGTTAGGLHLATMGGLWQAVTRGVLGLRPIKDGLLIDPWVPPDWGTITVRVIYHSTPVRIDASSDGLRVSASDPVALVITGIGPLREHHIEMSRTDAGRAWDRAHDQLMTGRSS